MLACCNLKLKLEPGRLERWLPIDSQKITKSWYWKREVIPFGFTAYLLMLHYSLGADHTTGITRQCHRHMHTTVQRVA